MHILAWIALSIVVLLLIWILFLRRFLKSHGYAQGFFAWIEPFEISVYKKSETILWARIQQLGGLVISTIQLVGVFDITPFLPIVPERHRVWVSVLPGACVSVNGIITEYQRRNSTKPVDVVALPDQLPPEVAVAVAKADAAKDNAVAVVAQAKEEQKL